MNVIMMFRYVFRHDSCVLIPKLLLWQRLFRNSWTHMYLIQGKQYVTPHLLTWWRHQMETFSALLTICAGNSPVTGQWRRALMFSLFSTWINVWVNNGEAGDLRRHRAHHDIIVMEAECFRRIRPIYTIAGEALATPRVMLSISAATKVLVM